MTNLIQSLLLTPKADPGSARINLPAPDTGSSFTDQYDREETSLVSAFSLSEGPVISEDHHVTPRADDLVTVEPFTYAPGADEPGYVDNDPSGDLIPEGDIDNVVQQRDRNNGRSATIGLVPGETRTGENDVLQTGLRSGQAEITKNRENENANYYFSDNSIEKNLDKTYNI